MYRICLSIALSVCLISTAWAQSPNAAANRRGVGSAAANRPTPQISNGRINNIRRGLLRQENRSFRNSRATAGSQNRSLTGQKSQFAGQRNAERKNLAATNRGVPQFRLTQPERAFQQRLASIDRLRDQAIESGNLSLLDQADRLERQTREQRANSLRNQPRVARLPQEDREIFGQRISAQAREDGRAFGQFTAEQAQLLGREFGQSNADKTRILVRPVIEEPSSEPVVIPEPVVNPEPIVEEPVVSEPILVPAP